MNITLLASVAGDLVFYLFREFAAIYYVHIAPLRKITLRFEKYGHFSLFAFIRRDLMMVAKIHFGVLDPPSDSLCTGGNILNLSSVAT